MPASRKFDLPKTDAIVVGSGPNGLAAAIRLAQAGKSVVVLEAAETPGGGARSAELTLPGFRHDVCSSVMAMGVCSPYLSTLPLEKYGLQWVFPRAAMAHPFSDGTAAVLYRSVEETAATLGEDGRGYRALMGDFAEHANDLLRDMLAPFHFPRHPFLFARFGLRALRAATSLARAYFRTEHARAFFAGMAAHSMLPLEYAATSAVTLGLAVSAHAGGWPFVRGGAQQLTASLVGYLESLGGKLITRCRVESLEQLPAGATILFDVTPKQLVQIAGERLPARYRKKLERYRYGPGAYKIDWALDQPIPWRAAECAQAGTVHLGETLEEISASESAPWRGETSPRPYVLLTQPSLFDPTRAPAGKHTAWGYCHVPNGFSPQHAQTRRASGAPDGGIPSLTQAIEAQVERFAPGFRECIAARSIMKPLEFEQYNENLIGGDIGGGAGSLGQLLLRPTASMYRTPLKGVYLCSASTPPGPGVHGMCGYFAAEAALEKQLLSH
ncbi:MAG TPA: NAD(P)/FAD-dependent oxidoreductase [Candidatus Angelobacter sp.]|nr:NAD(P)/FAD-dependent oxidoreductase [Candidatus Angelobacter sp.]